MEFPEIKLRQYVVVPKKPKMSPGKIASQVAHATFMALRKQDKVVYDYDNRENPIIIGRSEWDNIDEWEENGMCVIVLQCKTTEQLSNIAKYLEQWEIPHHLYIDEGLTEVDPMTPTALATGVIPEDKHWILNGLELFK